jgi:hypothetical protein
MVFQDSNERDALMGLQFPKSSSFAARTIVRDSAKSVALGHDVTLHVDHSIGIFGDCEMPKYQDDATKSAH